MNTNEIIIVDILKGVILKKFIEENYFFSNIPYNMIAAEGKFSANGDSFIISTYLGSISIYSIYSKNSYSTTYMNQFFDDEYRNSNDELNAIFPQYVNMYNLPYITQQPYSKYKFQTIKDNKRLTCNYSLTKKEIERKLFNNINYSDKAFEERQEDCEKEEKAFIQAAKDNITYMINDRTEQSDSSILDISENGSEIYYRRNYPNNNNRNNIINNSNVINSNNNYNNISNGRASNNINNNDNNINENEMIDYEFTSSYEEELDDLEDEEISIDSDDYGVVRNMKSNKFLSERARRCNTNTNINTVSDRARRWNLRSKDQNKNEDINYDESEIFEETKDNRYSKSLRTRCNQPKYNYDDLLNSKKKEISNLRLSKKLKTRKGKKLEFIDSDNLPKVRTRLGLRNRNTNNISHSKKNVIIDEEDELLENEIEKITKNKQKTINNDRSKNNHKSNYFKNNSSPNGNSSYSLRRNNINLCNLNDSLLDNENEDLRFGEDKSLIGNIDSNKGLKKRRIEEKIELNETHINGNKKTHKNFCSNLKNLSLGLNNLSNYEKKKQLLSENFISSYKDLAYDPFEYLNNIPNLNFSNFIKDLIKNCENKSELCSFCGNKGKNIVGPFFKTEIPKQNYYVYSLDKCKNITKYDHNNEKTNQIIFDDEENINDNINKESQIFFHIDCLILFNDNFNINLEIIDKINIEREEKDLFMVSINPVYEKILSNTINSTIIQNKFCFRCGSSNATIKCPEINCNKYFHGNVCLSKNCQIFNKIICCFDCIKKKFINEEKQKNNFNNYSKNFLGYETSINNVNFSNASRDFFLRNKFSFYNYYPQKGEKVYFVMQAYEDFLKKYHQYIIFELNNETIFFWKNFENINIKCSNKKFNPYYPFICEIRSIDFLFNNNDTINYLKKLHRGSYRDKIKILIKLNLEIIEINKTFEIIFMENNEPDFLINYDNFEVNNEFYENLQQNSLDNNLHNCCLETIISEINYKGRVIDVI